MTTQMKQRDLKKSITDASIPYGVHGMNLSVSEREVRVVTQSELAMRGVCRNLREDKSLMYMVRVSTDDLRTVILEPVDNEGIRMFKDLAAEFGDTL